MKSGRFFTEALLVNVFFLCPIAQGQVSRGPLDPISGYFDCTFDDELKLIETIRLPKEAEKYRELETADGKKRVSRIDGYTLKYSYPGTSVFVNLKVEQSTPKDFEADKKHILDNTNFLLLSAKYVDEKELRQSKINGFDVYSYERNTIEVGIVIGSAIIFDDRTQKVITIYFLSQKPGARKAKNIEEFRVLKDRFLDQFTKCLVSPK